MNAENLNNQIVTAARDELWKLGEVGWKFHKGQIDMAAAFDSSIERLFVINCSRQIGKSFFLCCKAIELCLKTPNTRVKYAAATQRMVKEIIHPLFRRILDDCPEQFRPKWRAQDGRFEFYNGSQITVAGADNQNADRLRGTGMEFGIVDEAGFVEDLFYLIKDILMPQTLTTRGRILIASTPSKYAKHPFEFYYNRAKARGASITKTIYDNPLLSQKDIEFFIDESGGVETTTWKREYLAQFVIDEKLVVLPEFTPDLQLRIVAQYARPTRADKYVSMDVGTRDFTFILFGYWDFRAAKLVIEDEIILQGSAEVRTDFIADAVRSKEIDLWNNERPYFRVSDVEPILINDLNSLHNMQFVAVRQDSKEASVNELRLMLQKERVMINPRCKILVSHLESAMWDDSIKSRNKFKRIQGFGHFDGVDALLYMLRSVRRNHNPFPPEYVSETNAHINKNSSWGKTKNAITLERALTSPYMNFFKPRN